MDWFYTPEKSEVGIIAPLSVSEVSHIIGSLLEDKRLQDIRVQGEITNYTHHARGHRYFSLSEKRGENGSTAAVIKCVMWRSDADRLTFDPQDGMDVIIAGSVRSYAPHGTYQLQVKAMEKAGLGEKYLLVERWKKELAQEGCFAAERKRLLPQYPRRVGVVTSETGAVIHDIRIVIERRYPVEIVISPTAVQGEDAHGQIAHAIRRLAGLVDVIIIARGGGSFEDLFPFNQPEVVRAIVASPVPVVSAIGHEVDVTLADLAADMRAPTPSAAAELVVPDQKELRERLKDLKNQMSSSLLSRVERAREECADLRDRIRPRRFLGKLEERQQNLADLAERFGRAFQTRTERERLILFRLQTALGGVNPSAVLSRGYCVAEKEGRVVNSVTEIRAGDRMKIRFSDGKSIVAVEQVDHDRNI
ncbi:MAG: exodeoxyribonuclease VII large subunit [Methanoregula sp.]